MNSKISAIIAIAMALGINSALAQTGNGAPSGTHYNLNILGKTQCAGDDLTDSHRHTIQVLLHGGDVATDLNGTLASAIDKRNKIYLTRGDDFQVLDGNACDGDGALFQLPAGGYDIYARALGKPGGSATMTTCATGAGDDLILGTADDEIVCSTENVVLVRATGKSSFTKVTEQLTTVLLEDGTRVSIFDPLLYDYFWNYENRGLRLAQLRFYPISE
jgi:hypothetical protein